MTLLFNFIFWRLKLHSLVRRESNQLIILLSQNFCDQSILKQNKQALIFFQNVKISNLFQLRLIQNKSCLNIFKKVIFLMEFKS